MRVGVIGINHRLADLRLRENFAKLCHHWFYTDHTLHGKQAFVLLSTCNRIEVYFSSSDLPYTHSYILKVLRQNLPYLEDCFDQKLYSYFGHDCFKHLVRVALGLDSPIVVETEIQNQVKISYETAKKYFLIPSDMHYLFQKSLKISKQIRTELSLGRGLPDLEHAILSVGVKTFQHPEQIQILFVGVSDINRKIVSFLNRKKFERITICNRSFKPAQALAKKYNLSILEWSKISEWHKFDWIIFGTKSPEYLISNHDVLCSLSNHKLIIDLCVPRNVDPSLGFHPEITLININLLNSLLKTRKKQMAHLLVKAENLVKAETQQHINLLIEKNIKREYFYNYSLSVERSLTA
jgi:glutamyl-tRNA reductase